MKNTAPRISDYPSVKRNVDSTPKMKLSDIKTMIDAKLFLGETITDFNNYDLTMDECLIKLDKYTDKVIEITR